MISSRAVAEANMEESSIFEALIIVLLCFFTLCSCFTSSAVDLAMKKPLSLSLNGYHVELATLVSTNSPLTSVSQNVDGTEISLVVATEVKDLSVDFIIEQYQHATSNSKSRSVSRGWWSWIQRLILMCFCLMVGGEGSSGTPPKDDKQGGSSSSSSPSLSLREALEKQRRDYAMYEEELRKFNIEVQAAQKEQRDKEFNSLIGIMLGGSGKIFEFFCDWYQKKCREQNREYQVLDAADIWLGMKHSEKRVFAEAAMTKYFRD